MRKKRKENKYLRKIRTRVGYKGYFLNKSENNFHLKEKYV